MSTNTTSTTKTAGIHHITAFVRNPQQTTDFYAGVLGLRLVKRRSTSMHLKSITFTSVTMLEAQERLLLSSLGQNPVKDVLEEGKSALQVMSCQ